jgi:TPR repeat protein
MDPARAVEYFVYSATNQFPAAFYNLGRVNEYGIGVETNKDLAYAFYKHADSEFQHELAHQALQRFNPSEISTIYDVQEELKQAAQHIAL